MSQEPSRQQRSRLPADPLFEQLAAQEPPPPDTLSDTAPRPAMRPGAPFALVALVMAGTVCLCVALVGMAGVAGYRDGLATNDARVTQTLATGVAEQYSLGVTELSEGRAEMAEIRFAWIVETLRAPTQYAQDSGVQLALARTMQAFTATPTVTPTPLPTQTPLPTVTSTPASATPTPVGGYDPDYLYEQAAMAFGVARYEDTIELLDSLRVIAPGHRPDEVHAMLMQALTNQGKIYLRGMNEDGEDRLMRGVLLIYRADEIGTVEPDTLVGEAAFVEMYINARNYVKGGQYAAALPILSQLCEWNCGWSYAGLSVRALYDEALAH